MNPNVTELIDSWKIGAFQIFVYMLCGCLVVIDGYDTQAISFAAPAIAELWGIDAGKFGAVFGAGLFGIMAGSMLLGTAADRWGRKKVIIAGLLIMGIFSILTASAASIGELIVFRFLTGVGIGGVLPNLASISAEFSPKRWQNTIIAVNFCGFPLGAILGGLAMAKLIPLYGWEIAFYAGGVLPLLFVPIVWIWMPESIRFLIHKGTESRRVLAIMRKINPAHPFEENQQFETVREQRKGVAVKQLFMNGLARNTLLIWIVIFMNQLMLYSMINWLPSILNAEGFPQDKAIISTVLFNAGGIAGGLILARLLDRKPDGRIMAAAFGIGAVVIGSIGFVGQSIPLLLFFVFLSGCFVGGNMLGVQAVSTLIYPTAFRSTGAGWAFGAGRIGSIIGPVTAGILLTLGVSLKAIFIAVAVPSLFAMAAMYGMRLKQPRE